MKFGLPVAGACACDSTAPVPRINRTTNSTADSLIRIAFVSPISVMICFKVKIDFALRVSASGRFHVCRKNDTVLSQPVDTPRFLVAKGSATITIRRHSRENPVTTTRALQPQIADKPGCGQPGEKSQYLYFHDPVRSTVQSPFLPAEVNRAVALPDRVTLQNPRSGYTDRRHHQKTEPASPSPPSIAHILPCSAGNTVAL